MKVLPYEPDNRSEMERIRSAYYKARGDNFRDNHGGNANQDIVTRARSNENEESSMLAAFARERQKGGGLLDALEDSTLGVLGAVGSKAAGMVRWLEESDAERKAKAAEKSLEGVQAEEEAVVAHNFYKVDARSCQIQSAAAALEQLQQEGCDLTAVRYMDLSVNYLTSVYAIDLPACDAIDVSLNHIEQFSPNQGLSLLRWLDMSKNRLTTVSGLMSCPLLTHLDVSMNRIELLGSFEPLKELQTFKLAGNKVQVLEGLHGLPSLSLLDASHNQLHDAKQIVFLPALTELNLSKNRLSELEPVQHALAGLPKLLSLELHGNPLREHRDYHMLLLELAELERLDGVVASPLLREQLQRVKGKTDVADLVSDTQNKYFARLQEKRAARDAQLDKLRQQEHEAEEAFLLFERQMNDEQQSCIAALRSLVAKGRSGKEEPLTPEELARVKAELLAMERERENARDHDRVRKDEQARKDALQLAGMKSNHEKLVDLAKLNPPKYHEYKQQQLERDRELEQLDDAQRQQEVSEALAAARRR